MNDLAEEIRKILNEACRENNSDTPDFVLAGYLMACLEAGETLIRKRDGYYGVDFKPGHLRGANGEADS